MHLVVDFKVLLIRLNIGSSLRENCNLLHPHLRLGYHQRYHQSLSDALGGKVPHMHEQERVLVTVGRAVIEVVARSWCLAVVTFKEEEVRGEPVRWRARK